MENQDTNTTNAVAHDMATFLGYEEVPLTRPIGDKKTVKVKCLPVRRFAEYAALIEDEPTLVEMFTGLASEEVDALAVDDFVAILRKGHGLNFVPFSDWLKRKVEAKKMIAQAYGIALPKESRREESLSDSPQE